MDDFLVRALLGGFGMALIAGPFGSFVVWRRLAYFGDTLAHSALLGVALGFLFEVDTTIAVIAVCLIVSVLLFLMQKQQRLPSDTLLGVLAHCALSLGLVSLAFMEHVRVDLVAYLFGDILAISWSDLLWVLLLGGVALGILLLIWQSLLAITVHRDMARVEGVPVDAVELAFSCLIALVVAIMMKIVGLLLVTALLIIPAASARRFIKSPEGMAVMAILIGCISVTAGLSASWQLNTPAGPSIVVASAFFFLLSQIVPARH